MGGAAARHKHISQSTNVILNIGVQDGTGAADVRFRSNVRLRKESSFSKVYVLPAKSVCCDRRYESTKELTPVSSS